MSSGVASPKVNMSPAASVRCAGKQHDDVAVGVGAAEVVELDALAAEVDMRVVLEHHGRQPGLLAVHHVLAGLLRRDACTFSACILALPPLWSA